MNRRRMGIAALALIAALVTACAPAKSEVSMPTEMTVFAAASLKVPMDRLVKRFELDNPGLKVHVNYAGSRTLVQQLHDGARADVLMTADAESMADATSNKLVGAPQEFATNTLTLAVARGNPRQVTGMDASLSAVKLVVCEPQVPCGRATEKLAGLNGVALKPVSAETNVSDVAAKVANGQADAGIVYATDVVARPAELQSLDIARAAEVVNRYQVAPTAKANEMAEYWLKLMASKLAAGILRDAGFGTAQ